MNFEWRGRCKRQAKKPAASGGIIAFDLTGGEAGDARHFERLLTSAPPFARTPPLPQGLRPFEVALGEAA